MEVKAIIFDLDGTLINSIDTYCRIVEIVLEKLKFPAVSRQTILDAAANGNFAWNTVLPQMPEAQLKKTHADIRKAVEHIYADKFHRDVRLFPGTEKMIRQMNLHRIKLGIVTATPNQNLPQKTAVLSRAGVLDYFQSIIASDDAPRKKPAPDPLLLCAGHLGLNPEDCVYIGDTKIDIIAGKAAGMKTIGVLTGFDTKTKLLKHAPDAVIQSVSDLPEIIDFSN